MPSETVSIVSDDGRETSNEEYQNKVVKRITRLLIAKVERRDRSL